MKKEAAMQIRRITEQDLPLRVEWMNDERVYSSMSFTLPITIEGTIKWYRANVINPNRFDAVILEDSGQIVAFGGLTDLDPLLKKAELYVFVDPCRQHQGLGRLSTLLLCEYAFDVMKLHKVYLMTNRSNIAARLTYERIGFKLEGTLRDEKLLNGKYEDRLYYGMLSSEIKCSNTSLTFRDGTDLTIEDYCIAGFPMKVVRDDIAKPFLGGVKSRKAVEYERYLKANGYNAMVTTGGIQSNHNRAIALMAAKNGWKCHVVFHGTRERFESEKGNALLVRLSGASYEFVEPEGISAAMDFAMKRFADDGLNPFYITGGGHDIPGGVALVNAVRELKRQCDLGGYKPKYIFHASGTGSTQAGIVVGLHLVGWSDVKVIGISIARPYERGRKVIVDFANMLGEHYGLSHDFADEIIFNADYIEDGYESSNEEEKRVIQETTLKTGLIFDSTYSGKALYGMLDYIKKNNINGNIVFWHTGGTMNIMA